MALSNQQIATLWVQEGGSPAAARMAAAIAKAESSGNPSATNRNTNGTVDRGLFQVNSIHGGQSTYDLRRNVRAAIAISNNGRNWSPWTTYKTGAYKHYFKGAGSALSGGGSPTITRTPASTTTDTNGAIVDALLHSGPVKGSIHRDLLGHALSLVQSGAYTHTTPAKTTVSMGQSAANNTAPAGSGHLDHFDGKPVAGWIAQELRWARAHGWTGTLTSGYRSDAQQTAIYKSGARPAAVPKSMGGPGSNHEGFVFPFGAADVTKAAELAAILRQNPHSRLVYAGAKDPVHFSHPHGGGY
ncbi:MAG: transglycosylase SLT domain-containing protein [Mycobacteriaceae bacterium]